MNLKWTEQELQLIRDRYPKEGYVIVKDLPGRSKRAVFERARLLGIKRVGFYNTFNSQFFDIPNIQNSYWAGFIAADGYVSSGKPASIAIKLSAKDRNILELFKKHVEFTGKIEECGDWKDGKYHNKVQIRINGAYEWKKNLKKHYNIGPQKSLTLRPPKIKDLMLSLAFIVGYIDGDGSFGYTKGSKCYKFWPFLHLAGTSWFLNWVAKIFDELVPQKKKNRARKTQTKIKSLCYYGWRSLEIKQKLIDMVDIPWRLPRKWNNEYYKRKDGEKIEFWDLKTRTNSFYYDPNKYGVKNSMQGKITPEIIKEIRKLWLQPDGPTLRELKEKFKFSVSRICRNTSHFDPNYHPPIKRKIKN